MEEKKMTITITEPVIKKVSMIEGGKNGLEVKYTSNMFRDGVRSSIEDKGQKHKRPVHKELRVLFKELHKTFLEMCGYKWKKESELELMKGNVSMMSMMYDRGKDTIQLVGVIKVSDKYKFAVTGPTMNMNDVDDSEEVQVIIDKILEEAKLFANGIRGMERSDLSKAYMVQKKAIAQDEVDSVYENMTAAEKEEMLTLAFEDCGLDVVEENGKMVIGVKEETKLVKNLDVESFTEELVSKNAPALNEYKEIVVSEEVDFSIPVNLEDTPDF